MGGELKKILRGHLAPEELAVLVQSYDVVGDIAIIVIPEALLGRKGLIAEAILHRHRRIKVVARRAGIYDGEFRTLPLEVIVSDNGSVDTSLASLEARHGADSRLRVLRNGANLGFAGGHNRALPWARARKRPRARQRW